MAYFETPTPVKIDQLDLGDIQKTNALNAMYQQRLQDMAYDTNSRNALNDAFRADPTGQSVPNALARGGYGSMVPDLQSKIGNNALLQAKIAKAQTDFISTYAPLVKDQNSLDMVRTKYNATFGDDFPQQFQTYYDGIGQDAYRMSLGGAQNLQLNRVDTTLKNNGYAPGQDPTTLGAISSMRNAADANTRGWNADSREAETQPWRVKNYQSEIDTRTAAASRPRIIMMPDTTNDPDGLLGKKVPGYYDENTNSLIPFSVSPNQGGGSPGVTTPGGTSSTAAPGISNAAPPAGSGDTAGGTGQGQQQPPVAGAKLARDGKWYVPDPNRPGKYLQVIK